jgi:Mce-associated membrane protein
MADDAAAPTGELSEPASSPRDRGRPTTPAPHARPDAAEREDAARGEVTADYDAEVDHDGEDAKPARKRMSHLILAMLAGLVVVVALAGLVGWLGFRASESHQATERRDLFLQVGRQGAIDLTTIDYTRADADIRRILDSATGTFYDDFSKRSQPFVDAVKQAQSKSVGTVTAAGVESETATDAQVLVAVTVKTSNAGAAEQPPRAWRMRIQVQKVADQAKVSNVEFVP